ncbi:MFS transporter [Niveibacterium umoris]|uniref:MFS family permease n=1 Tax=Niveibacterium umoris TaxID=1193620 RepID=A0A840BLY0_9RHOO|nr:MFS transporter [Niveibacterium umoris]MBB4012568.1 MFS family permease [Niveibacterium umoris]
MNPQTDPLAGHSDPKRALFANRNFRWLLGGGALSMLGDQFTQIALPWLVLKMTGDPLVLGTVLAVVSLPRAIFILIGGALVDRYSPHRVLLLTKYLNAALIGLLAALVWSGTIQLWMVYGLALAIGLVTAFSFPAGSSILPQALPPQSLQAANGFLMGLRQLTVLIGPLLAGLLIATFGDAAAPHAAGKIENAAGLGMAFAFDALTFAISAWTLQQVQTIVLAGNGGARSVLHAVGEAMGAMWRDVELRALCLYFAAIAFFVGGPLQVALPVLANTQLQGGAAALGFLLAGHGIGSLLGMVLAGALPKWRLKTLGLTVLAIDATAALTFLPFGHITATWQGVALLAPLGALAGYVQVAVFTWMQRRVPPAMLGRAMSVFMFIFMGLSPLAAAAAGAALRVLNPAALFTASGLSLLMIVLLGVSLTPIRRITDQPADQAPATQPA